MPDSVQASRRRQTKAGKQIAMAQKLRAAPAMSASTKRSPSAGRAPADRRRLQPGYDRRRRGSLAASSAPPTASARTRGPSTSSTVAKLTPSTITAARSATGQDRGAPGTSAATGRRPTRHEPAARPRGGRRTSSSSAADHRDDPLAPVERGGEAQPARLPAPQPRHLERQHRRRQQRAQRRQQIRQRGQAAAAQQHQRAANQRKGDQRRQAGEKCLARGAELAACRRRGRAPDG